MQYQEILHRCFRCGYCKLPAEYNDLNCPSYLKYRFETFSPGGRMWLLRGLVQGDIEPSSRLARIMFSCAACANCIQNCVFPKFKQDLLNAFTAGREELVNQAVVPPEAAAYFKAINLYGNPYKLPETERSAWSDSIDVQTYSGQEFLFYTGCVGAYDERGQKMARSVAGLLAELGVSFGTLSQKETCDGNEVRAMGEKGLFEKLARQNIQVFQEAGVKKIITLSPHGFHALKNFYPFYGSSFEVYHYPQVLAGLVNKIKFSAQQPTRVTFHDPCYLGRHNGDYFTPRLVLGSIPGVELIEMDRNKQDSLCCGGGGGNFFTDILGGGPDASSRVRVREAKETGADIIAVACPKCAKMIEDALKAEALEDSLKVMDLAELMVSRKE